MHSKRHLGFTAAVILAVVWPGQSHADTKAPINGAAISQAVGKIAAEIRAGYVFPEKGERAALAVEKSLMANAYKDVTDSDAFATRMTEQLQAITGDGHIRVVNGLPPALKGAPPPPTETGFERVEKLAGNIGYIRLNRFVPPETFKAPADDAMRVVAETKALIIDMRGNRGGHPASVAYLAGFLFNPTQTIHINSIVWRNKGTADFRTEEFRTAPTPTQYLNKPVYVLVGPVTYSGGEEFAYDLQVLKRATIVGAKTGGGANPGGLTPIGGDLFVVVPSGRAENPLTKTNWEGVGILPEVETTAETALDRAVTLALAAPER